MLWVPEGTLSQKMTENILIVNFHTLPYHKMTPLGLWRAKNDSFGALESQCRPKIDPKRSNLTWFCNKLQFFTYFFYLWYKNVQISLFTSNQTPMVISGCFMAVSMSKMDPKRPKFDIICTKIQSFYTICLSVPETHLHVFLPRMKSLWSFLDILWFYLSISFWLSGQFLTSDLTVMN